MGKAILGMGLKSHPLTCIEVIDLELVCVLAWVPFGPLSKLGITGFELRRFGHPFGKGHSPHLSRFAA